MTYQGFTMAGINKVILSEKVRPLSVFQRFDPLQQQIDLLLKINDL